MSTVVVHCSSLISERILFVFDAFINYSWTAVVTRVRAIFMSVLAVSGHVAEHQKREGQT